MRSINEMARPARLYGRGGPRDVGTLVVWIERVTDPVTGRVSERERTRTWPNALPGHRSPCRPDSSKGLHQHRCSSAHRALVDGYRAVRRHEEQACEEASIGYATEEADYWREHPRTTFRDYLIAMRQKDAA